MNDWKPDHLVWPTDSYGGKSYKKLYHREDPHDCVKV